MSQGNSVVSILRTVFALESDFVLSQSQVWSDMRGGSVKGVSVYDTAWDRHADAAMLLRYMKDNCRDFAILECRYRSTGTRNLRMAKQQACAEVAWGMRDGYKCKPRYVQLCVEEWSGIWMRKGWINQWMSQMSKSKSALYHMRNKLKRELSVRERRALDELTAVMTMEGLLE